METLKETTRKAYYDWTEDERHGICHAWGIMHGCPGCPAMGSKPECPNKEENE